MDVPGYKCPKCGKEFDECKAISSPGGRLRGICKGCDIICFMDDYSAFLQKVQRIRQRKMAYQGAKVQKKMVDYPMLRPRCFEKKKKKFNPTER